MEKKCELDFQSLQDTLDVIGSKWRVQILASICVGGNNRFREIEKSIPGLTTYPLYTSLTILNISHLQKKLSSPVLKVVYPGRDWLL